MYDNNVKGITGLLKGFLGITMSVAIIGTSMLTVRAKEDEYPYSSKFPNGIEDTDISVFTESEIEYPLNMNWETNEEIEFVKSNSEGGQISLTEDAYDGKFALQIKPVSEEPVKIKETSDFVIGSNPAPFAMYNLRTGNSSNGLNIDVIDKIIMITGTANDADVKIGLIVFDSEGNIEHVDQKTSGSDASFEFSFSVDKYDTYTLRIGIAQETTIEETISVTGEDYNKVISDESLRPPEPVTTKTNIVKLWIKPKYNAKNISFFVTATCNGEEKQLRILGDKDNDGLYNVPDDISQGKWQEITLDLLKSEEFPDDAEVKNLYISANSDSQWVIDTVVSSYREIAPNTVELTQFTSDNIVENDGLRFDISSDGSYINLSRTVSGKIDLEEHISSVVVDSEFEKKTDSGNTYSTTNEKTAVYSIPGFADGMLSGDLRKVIYRNSTDNNYIYSFDTTDFTSTKLLEISQRVTDISYNGDKIMTNNGVYDTNTGEHIPPMSNSQQYLSPDGDIFAIITADKKTLAYKYYDGVYTLFHENRTISNSRYTMAFSNFSNIFSIVCDTSWYFYEDKGDGCRFIDSAYLSNEYEIGTAFISNDGTKLLYYDSYDAKAYRYDFDTKQFTTLSNRYVRQAADGRYVISNTNLSTNQNNSLSNYYLYDEITGTKEMIYGGSANYCSERNQTFSFVDKSLKVVDLNMSTEYNKYLLSFDGKKTWYAYKDAKWLQASSSSAPSISEMKENGMTKEEINAIPEDAFGKIYANGNEVYTLNFAIGMFGSTDYITPVVKSIKVNTIANDPVDCIYSSKLFPFSKSGYRKINGVFPVEDFPKVSECYYLLYLGNDWIYTYKGGKISKLGYKADDLLSDIAANWMTIKMSGLSASEVRAIPGNILTELFVNDKFANDSFGLIAVSKIKDTSTAEYKTNVKLSAETKYISEEGYVLEISLTGTEKLIFSPEDITKAEIEDFLSWVSERQNNNGDVFYRLKTQSSQHLINYYGISNINVYQSQAESSIEE